MTNGHFFLAQQNKVKMCGFYGLKKSAVGEEEGLWLGLRAKKEIVSSPSFQSFTSNGSCYNKWNDILE